MTVLPLRHFVIRTSHLIDCYYLVVTMGISSKDRKVGCVAKKFNLSVMYMQQNSTCLFISNVNWAEVMYLNFLLPVMCFLRCVVGGKLVEHGTSRSIAHPLPPASLLPSASLNLSSHWSRAG